MEKYIDYETVKFDINQIQDFKLNSEFSKSIFWSNGKIDIYASPQWDEEFGKCPIQLSYGEELTDGHDFDLGKPYDLENQKKRYLEIITDLINDLKNPFTNYNNLLETVLNKYKIKAEIIDIDGLIYDGDEVELFEGQIVDLIEIDEYEQALICTNNGEKHTIFSYRIQILNF